MRITVDHSLTGHGDVDLDVARGTALSEIVAECGPQVVWCGTRRLDPTHPAGIPPLVAGAVLSALPGRDKVDPASLHLAAIAGPDAGVLVSIDSPTALGSASPAVILRDAACDPHHATLTPKPRGELRVRDEGTVNGTGVWVLRAGELRWRGRRRRTWLRSGDVLAVGRTLLEVRGGASASAQARWRRPWPAGPLLASAATAFRTVALAGQRSGSLALDLRGWPDPTRVGACNADWAAPVAIRGPHADEVARAVILARGRRPPAPSPLDEPWLSWLPDPLPSDGPIRIEQSERATGFEGWAILTADSDRMTLNRNGVATTGPAVRAREDTADALVRSLAGSLPEPPPRVIGWAHAASLATARSGPPADGLARAGWKNPSDRAVVAGVHVDHPAKPWRLEMGSSSRLTLISGASGSGKTTLMATIAGALAVSSSPDDLRIVILCAGNPGPLEPYLRLPHVTAFATCAEPRDALELLAVQYAHDALTVVIADDLDRLGPDGRAVAARLESLGLEGDGSALHVIMATAQPAAVFTPSLRAAKGTAVALRAARPADSVEVIGVEAAASLPPDSPGRALVRSAGRIDAVQVALPWADAPRVRPWGAPVPGVRSLAEAACPASGTSSSTPPSRDPARPAS